MNPSPVKVTKKKLIEERRCLKHSGKPYTTSSGKAMKGKEHSSVIITCKCRYGCKTLSKEYRDQLFMEFYKISYKDQGTYLLNRMQVAEISRPRHGKYADPSESTRKITVYYTVPNGRGQHVQVCSNTFKNIFGLSARRLQTLQHLKKQGKLVYEDRRGKVPGCNAHKKKHSDCDRNLVRCHILSFPREEDFPKLKFARPRTDTCNKCDKLNASVSVSASPAEKRIAETQLQLHILKSDEAQDIMREDTIRSQMPGSSVTVFAMDLQQVLFVPTLTHSRMFYSRQLSCYNLCIHDSTNNESYMNMWHEGIDGRGGNDVASCLFKIMTTKVTTRRVILWADNCAGQNKNRMILIVLIYLVAKNFLDEMTIKFFVSGHSFMPCDRDFGLIEKRKRNCKAMVPSDLDDVITSSRPSKPFKVVHMENEDFFDFAAIADGYISTTKLGISKLSQIRVSRSNPNEISHKEDFSDLLPFSTHKVFKKNKNHSELPPLPKFPRLPTKNGISVEKKKDLLNL
ncbi:hypothetical protein AVEN_136312-1 [Araneus ventricosus]|uniref:DUF7869 domain-containing protein n=1 Tax=Araneus ventricosus TaxID=182803 RepID=A0A4Y2PF71_ARAVE|nr:hypothetical protein AVEN_136312-1 [Araneus ventricosus]